MCFKFFNHFQVYCFSQICFFRIHVERASKRKPFFILWNDMKMEVSQFVGVCTIVYLLWRKDFLHGFGNVSHILHKQVSIFSAKLKQFVDMIFIRYDTSPGVALLLEQEEGRCFKIADLNHQFFL